MSLIVRIPDPDLAAILHYASLGRRLDFDGLEGSGRRLQLMMNMVMQVIQQDRSLPVEQASEMVADARRAALAMFPDKALAFDLIFWPRLQRLMRERYRMQ